MTPLGTVATMKNEETICSCVCPTACELGRRMAEAAINEGLIEAQSVNRTQLFRCPLEIHFNDSHRKNCAIFVGFFWPANDTHSSSRLCNDG